MTFDICRESLEYLIMWVTSKVETYGRETWFAPRQQSINHWRVCVLLTQHISCSTTSTTGIKKWCTCKHQSISVKYIYIVSLPDNTHVIKYSKLFPPFFLSHAVNGRVWEWGYKSLKTVLSENINYMYIHLLCQTYGLHNHLWEASLSSNHTFTILHFAQWKGCIWKANTKQSFSLQ